MTDRPHRLLTDRIRLAPTTPPRTRPAFRGPPPVGRLVGDIGAPLRKKFGFETPDILIRWRDIVGPDLARDVTPQKVTGKPGDKTLTIVSPGALALELQHMAPQILDRINSFYGFHAIERLRFVHGPAAASRKK